jgi:biotin carboxylase
MKLGRVGFYDVWSPKGEDPSWARQVIAAGFRRIGASPDAMDKLDKINLKKLVAVAKLRLFKGLFTKVIFL